MTNLKNLRYGSATYKVKPNALSNLKIKFKISKLSSSFQQEDNMNSVTYSEEFIFSWQQKVFSPVERVKYSSNITHPSVIEEKYCQDVKNLRQINAFPTKRLFSYVDHDEYIHNSHFFTTKDPTTLSYVGNIVDQVRKRYTPTIDSWKSGMKFNPVVEDLSEEQLLSRHIPNPSAQQMFIMVDLNYPLNDPGSENSITWQPHEVVLCRISVDDNGSFTVQPDFSKRDNTYVVENTSTKENYEYSIVNVSITIPSTEKEKEIKLLKELYARSTDRILSIVGANFDDQMQENALRLFITGEILSATGFEYASIYIQYFVDVPEDWMASNLDQLTGITQISRGKVVESGYLCYFSFPFEIDMVYQKSIFRQDNIDVFPKWPVVYIEVFSIDSMSRYRTEGYGYTQLPTTPGIHKINVLCWRPISDSITNELRRYFVGGSAELEDLTYTSIPGTFEGKYLSKYGFRTISSGNVSLRLNCIQQSRAFVDEKLNKTKSGSLADRISGSNVHMGVMEVINAFRRAKERLIHIREGDSFHKN